MPAMPPTAGNTLSERPSTWRDQQPRRVLQTNLLPIGRISWDLTSGLNDPNTHAARKHPCKRIRNPNQRQFKLSSGLSLRKLVRNVYLRPIFPPKHHTPRGYGGLVTALTRNSAGGFQRTSGYFQRAHRQASAA